MSTYIGRVVMAKLGFFLAKRASRNQTAFDRFARRLLPTLLPKCEFELDEMVIADQGYDPDELERYQKGL
jgi:hypothetical protein